MPLLKSILLSELFSNNYKNKQNIPNDKVTWITRYILACSTGSHLKLID